MNRFNLQTIRTRAADLVTGRAAVVALASTAGSASVFAQATDPFDTAMTTVTAKVEAYAAALVGLAAVAVVFMIAIKYVKKIPKAS